jgi:hypothetical protein
MTTSSIQDVMAVGDIATAASRQYFSRPADQKYRELDDLHAAVHGRRMRAQQFEAGVSDIRAKSTPRGLVLASKGYDMTPTHWAFGQSCNLIGAPAAYLRKLAATGAENLVVDCLNHGIAKRDAAGIKFLAVDEPDGESTTMYAATSPSYGRIWDADVVDAAKRVIDAQNGTFYSPWGWGKSHRALFASHQDVFMYFIDGGSIVDGGGERDQLNRGVFIWNSEVGAATFGIATFLFRQTCGNFMVWGVQNAKILNIRHTSGGPERFVSDAVPALHEFAQSSVAQLEEGVRAAKRYALSTDDDEIVTFAIKHGFNRAETKRAIEAARTEEGQCASLWDLCNGFTACARNFAYADAKIDLETRAGNLMKLAAA